MCLVCQVGCVKIDLPYNVLSEDKFTPQIWAMYVIKTTNFGIIVLNKRYVQDDQKSRLNVPVRVSFIEFIIIAVSLENIIENKVILTLIPLSTTIVQYANSLDLDETLSNSASYTDLTI